MVESDLPSTRPLPTRANQAIFEVRFFRQPYNGIIAPFFARLSFDATPDTLPFAGVSSSDKPNRQNR
jgi:hypothetical protein